MTTIPTDKAARHENVFRVLFVSIVLLVGWLLCADGIHNIVQFSKIGKCSNAQHFVFESDQNLLLALSSFKIGRGIACPGKDKRF